MKPAKWELIDRYGMRCMLCGKEFSYKEINFHHIKPKYVFKQDGLKPDDSADNGSILCVKCHCKIHEYLWWDDEYQLLTEIILQNKK